MKKNYHKSFQFDVKAFCSIKKEYTLENKITGEIKKIPKHDFDVLFKEQYGHMERKK